MKIALAFLLIAIGIFWEEIRFFFRGPPPPPGAPTA